MANGDPPPPPAPAHGVIHQLENVIQGHPLIVLGSLLVTPFLAGLGAFAFVVDWTGRDIVPETVIATKDAKIDELEHKVQKLEQELKDARAAGGESFDQGVQADLRQRWAKAYIACDNLMRNAKVTTIAGLEKYLRELDRLGLPEIQSEVQSALEIVDAVQNPGFEKPTELFMAKLEQIKFLVDKNRRGK